MSTCEGMARRRSTGREMAHCMAWPCCARANRGVKSRFQSQLSRFGTQLLFRADVQVTLGADASKSSTKILGGQRPDPAQRRSDIFGPVARSFLRVFNSLFEQLHCLFLCGLPLPFGGKIEAGKITPVIDRRYPLTKTAEAIAYVEEGHARAKVIISVQ